MLAFDIRTSGTQNSPIVFKVIENNVVIDQRNSVTPDGINIENTSWIVIDGFEIKDQPCAGIRAVFSDFITIKNNYCHNNYRWGIFTGFTDDITIENNSCSFQVYTCWTVTETQQKYFFYPLLQITLLGVNWAFITGDLFNLFVAYEVMLLGSYGMMMVGASRPQVRQTLKYVAINSIGSTLFVVGCGVVYATVGTLNMADLAVRTAALAGERSGMVTAASMILLVVFGLKAATFPLTYWLPDCYPVVPAGVIGYIAGLLTKVGVYSLLRTFVMLFRQDSSGFASDALLFLSGFTMLLGVLGAMAGFGDDRMRSDPDAARREETLFADAVLRDRHARGLGTDCAMLSARNASAAAGTFSNSVVAARQRRASLASAASSR